MRRLTAGVKSAYARRVRLSNTGRLRVGVLGGLASAVCVAVLVGAARSQGSVLTGSGYYDLGDVVSAFARAGLPVFVNEYAPSAYLGSWQLQQAGLPKPTQPWIPNGIPDIETDFYVYVLRSPPLASAFVRDGKAAAGASGQLWARQGNVVLHSNIRLTPVRTAEDRHEYREWQAETRALNGLTARTATPPAGGVTEPSPILPPLLEITYVTPTVARGKAVTFKVIARRGSICTPYLVAPAGAVTALPRHNVINGHTTWLYQLSQRAAVGEWEVQVGCFNRGAYAPAVKTFTVTS